MQKKRIIISIAALLILFIGYLFFSGKNKASSSPTLTVTEGEIIVKVTAVGNIISAKTAAVKSPVSGIVAQLFHEEGDAVKKGDALLMVKPQPTPKDYATTKQQVETDLLTEKADLAEVKRYESLMKQGAISKNDQDYVKAITTYESARLKRELDQKILALLEEGKTDLQDKTVNNVIYSPIDGFVVERVINLGDPVAPQTDYQTGNVLLTVADMSSLIFKGQVSEADAAKLHIGVVATVKIAALPDVAIVGKLSQLSLQSAQLATPLPPSSGTSSPNSNNSPFSVGYKVEVSHLAVPPAVQLRAGYSATAEAVVATAQHALIIPERILQFEQNKTYVWRVNKKNQPAKQFITLGLSDGVNVQVLTGLKAGEKLLEIPPDEPKPSVG